jgi:outer membrane lipoprotein SlyB
MRSSAFAVAAVCVVLAAGCASPRHSAPVPSAPQGSYYGSQYGVVHSIDMVRAQSQTSGGGAVVGGAIGGLVGRQLEHGRNRDLATGVGVVAGAIIGNEIEKNQRGARDIYRVTVQFHRGGLRSFDYASLNEDLRVGDRVRIENNQLYRW